MCDQIGKHLMDNSSLYIPFFFLFFRTIDTTIESGTISWPLSSSRTRAWALISSRALMALPPVAPPLLLQLMIHIIKIDGIM
jgi:hypothetical protein